MSDTPIPGPREFSTTRWSLVAAVGADAASPSRASEALEQLCRAYWYPLYAFVRRRGYSPADAQDLTQAFFTQFLDARGFAQADRRRGRFRSYLLGAMKHFLANEWHRARSQKRGGGAALLEWDALDAETRYALEPEAPADLDLSYDRDWASELIVRATERLRAESEASGKGALFATLKGSLVGEEVSRTEAAAKLSLTEGAIKVAIHRLRQRFRECLRAEIAETVATRAEIDEEMRYLVTALRAR